MQSHVSTFVLSSIFTEWGLEASDRHLLEGLGLEGAEHLCAIHVALGQIFAHNPKLAALWPTTSNNALQKLSPMDVIRRDGLAGIKRVRSLLE